MEFGEDYNFLTKRTKETLDYILLGLRGYVIAQLMGVSKHAVKMHVERAVKHYIKTHPWANVKTAHDIFLLENHPEIYFKFAIASKKITVENLNEFNLLPKGLRNRPSIPDLEF